MIKNSPTNAIPTAIQDLILTLYLKMNAEAIGMKTPDEVYHISERKYTGDYDEIEYPIGYLPRKVGKSGHIKISSIPVNIGVSLAGLTVGLRVKNAMVFDVFLSDFFLGTIDMNSCCFLPLDVVK